jgi:dCTP diphosphatase
MDRLEEILAELREFVAEREWRQFHDPKNLTMALASEVGELLAEYRWVRNEEAEEYSRQSGRAQKIEAEIADVGITLLLLCDRTGVNFLDAVKRKIAVNRKNYPVDRSRGRSERPPQGDG